MKRFALTLGLLFCAGPAFAATCSNTTFTSTVIKCIQSTSTDCTALLDCSIAYPASPGIGHTLLVVCGAYQYTSNANAIAATEAVNDSATQANTWTTALTPGLWASGGALGSTVQDSKEGAFVATAKATAADTPHCVTASGGTPATLFMVIYELSSVNGTIAVDASAAMVDGAGVGTTTCPSGNMTPAKNGDMLFGYCNYGDGGITTAGSGWTEIDTGVVGQGKGQLTAATVNSVWVAASMSHWVAGAIAFSDGTAVSSTVPGWPGRTTGPSFAISILIGILIGVGYGQSLDRYLRGAGSVAWNYPGQDQPALGSPVIDLVPSADGSYQAVVRAERS